MNTGELQEKFQTHFGVTPRLYRAPGRVNLIGEHTDYNQGLVMPMAIDASMWVAAAPRDDRHMVLRSENFTETVDFDLDEPNPQRRGHWSDYPRGVALMLERTGHRLTGAHILFDGEVAVGSGLSSSAAIEVGTGYALLDTADIKIDRLELALACQRAENEFVGMRCGLMDQFISCFAEKGKALMLDCRSLEYKVLPLPETVKAVVCNTMVKHELASSEYNARRAECEEGVQLLTQKLQHVRSLRDMKITDLERYQSELPEVIYRRCRHVVTENARVVAAAAALERGDLTGLKDLMAESHRSLRDDYQVSCRELDLMVDLANRLEGVYGARMTGGGFGGCSVNLVTVDRVNEFKQRVGSDYERSTGINPEIYVCSAAQGAERVM